MDIQFYGANCLVLSGKQARLVVDDNLSALGAKSVLRDGDICIFTNEHGKAASPLTAKPKIMVDMPGEYEAGSVSILGIQVRAHMDEGGKKSGTMYKVTWGDTKVLITGHVFPKLSEAELETIGLIDVMLVPVGGNGYTLDGTGAMQLIKQVEPKVVVPTHYADSSLAFEVPQQSLEDALKAMGMEPKETTKKFQFKAAEATDTTQLVVIEKS